MQPISLNHVLLLDLPRKVTLQGCLQQNQHQVELYVSDEHIIQLLNELQALPSTKTNFVGMNELIPLQDELENQIPQYSRKKTIILTIEILENSPAVTSNLHTPHHVLVTMFWSGDDDTFSELKKEIKRHWNVLFDINP